MNQQEMIKLLQQLNAGQTPQPQFDTSQDVGAIKPVQLSPAQQRVQGLANLLQNLGQRNVPLFGTFKDPRQAYQFADKLTFLDPTKQGGIGEFLPGLSYELAKERQDPLGQGLSLLDMIPGGPVIGAPIKNAAKEAAEQITRKKEVLTSQPKDMMFVHNTSEKAIKGFDEMGGIPSPSLAVQTSDVPLQGFGDIQLIGKPKSFDPSINLKNAIYSSDAYTPRVPAPFRVANKNAYKELKNDYQDIANKFNLRIDSVVDDMYSQSFKKNAANSYGNSEINRFFDYDDAPKIKFLQEKGINIQPIYKGGMDLEIKPYIFRGKTPMLGLYNKKTGEKIYSQRNNESGKNLLEQVKSNNEKVSIDNIETKKQINKQLKKFNSTEYDAWINSQKNKYLQNDLFFKSGGLFDNPKTKEYTLDNLVNYMKRQPQVGGEGDGIGTKGIGRLKAALTGKFKNLDEIKGAKSQIIDKEKAKDVYKKTEDEFFAITNDLYNSLPNKSSYNQFSFIDDVSDLIFDAIQKGGSAKEIKSSFDFLNISDKQINKIQQFLKNLKEAPVQYFEAKPTRAVDFSEFAGAIVPPKTSKEVIDILEKRGLKVVKSDPEIDPTKTKARQEFKDQMFSLAPVLGVGTILAQQNKNAGLLNPQEEIQK